MHAQVLLVELQTDEGLEVCEGTSWERMVTAPLPKEEPFIPSLTRCMHL